MSKSLRKDVYQFARVTFPEVYPHVRLSLLKRFVSFLNSPKRALWVVPITITLFTIGQMFSPAFLQWMHIPVDSSRIIIDQRISNLATIFSITLVVIGWLLTNLSVKESLSFQLLFKRTYLYPIFYFVGTLIACLIIFSLLRHESYIDLGNIVIAGTCLIILALILITFLFVGFIKVVDAAFLYDALGAEVIKEVNVLAKTEILTRRSRTLYKEECESLNLNDGIRFNTNLSAHTGVNITPLEDDIESSQEDEADIFGSKKKYEVYDMNLERLSSQVEQLNMTDTCYFSSLQIGSVITENYCPFYIHNNITLPNKFSRKVRKAYCLRPPRQIKRLETRHLAYFNDRFMKDVKEGKTDNIQKGLAIYAMMFDLEDKIYSKC
jgi:hypothetical protein